MNEIITYKLMSSLKLIPDMKKSFAKLEGMKFEQNWN